MAQQSDDLAILSPTLTSHCHVFVAVDVPEGEGEDAHIVKPHIPQTMWISEKQRATSAKVQERHVSILLLPICVGVLMHGLF